MYEKLLELISEFDKVAVYEAKKISCISIY